jgi:hypothetical protein
MSYLGNTPTTQSFISGTDYFNGTGSQTAFTLSRTVASVNDVEAVVNNVVQRPNDAYNISGTTITFTSAPSSGTSNIYVRYLSTTTQSITPSQNTVSYATWNSDLQGETWAFRNRLINGDMQIDQRNNGASVTPASGDYTLDRWVYFASQASKFTAQQSSIAPSGFTRSLLFTTISAVSVGASDTFQFQQPIEGLNVADLGWGTANAQTVTLSFWVRSSLTGTFGGALKNPSSRSYPFTYTISAANTWEQKSITVPGDTTGTWATDNSAGIRVAFGLGSGSTFSGTAGSWQAGNLSTATGAVSVVGTNGATFYITGVQLEKGFTATNFDVLPYGTELALCQRYYEVISCGNETLLGTYTSGNGSRFNISAIPFAVEKRTAPSMPTVTPTGQWVISGVAAVSANTATNFTPLNPTTRTFGVNSQRTSGGSAPTNAGAYIWEQSATFTASAEL